MVKIRPDTKKQKALTEIAMYITEATAPMQAPKQIHRGSQHGALWRLHMIARVQDG